MIKTVIFDMDGVIVDTEPVHYYAYHEHFKQLGIEVPHEMYTTFTGNSTKNVYQRIKDYFGLSQEVPELIQSKRSIFNDAFDNKPDLYLIDGVEALIKDLHANEIRLILASSAANVTIQRVFNRFGLHRYFSHLLSGEDFEFSKPNPAIFLKAWELSGDEKSECIVIEDSTNGVAAANAAGIFCLGYVSENSLSQNIENANAIVADFNKIDASFIKNLR